MSESHLPNPSPRLAYWLRRIEAGFRPNRRLRSLSYDDRAAFYGVTVDEQIKILDPKLYAYPPTRKEPMNDNGSRILNPLGEPARPQPLSFDPVQRYLLPCYFQTVAALAGANHGATPEAVADEAMEFAFAAMRRAGFNVIEERKENGQ